MEDRCPGHTIAFLLWQPLRRCDQGDPVDAGTRWV